MGTLTINVQELKNNILRSRPKSFAGMTLLLRFTELMVVFNCQDDEFLFYDGEVALYY